MERAPRPRSGRARHPASGALSAPARSIRRPRSRSETSCPEATGTRPDPGTTWRRASGAGPSRRGLRICRRPGASGGVSLSWTAPTGAPATGYQVLRGTSTGGESLTPITTTGTDLLSRRERLGRHDLLLRRRRGQRLRKWALLERGVRRRPEPSHRSGPARRSLGESPGTGRPSSASPLRPPTAAPRSRPTP